MSNIRIPHVFIFLFWIIILCAACTYLIPSGKYERTARNYGTITQTVVVPGTYQQIPKHYSIKAATVGAEIDGSSSPVSLLGILSAIPKGLADSAVLVFYVFIIGALFTLIHHTGAISALLFSLIARFREHPMWLFFLIYMLFFSGSAFMGIGPETIAIVPVFLFLSKQLGYDRIFGFALLMVPIFLGWSTGVTNPFTVQIAQIIAELPVGSGIGLRLVMFVVYAIIGFYFLMKYGNRVKADPTVALMKDDPFNLDEFGAFEEKPFTKMRKGILMVFVVGYAAILIAVQTIGWGLIEMSACFIGIMIITSWIAGMKGDELMNSVTKGLEIMIVPALVVGVARGISVVLQEGMIIDTILYYASSFLGTMPRMLAAEGMLLFQSMLNFFIPSASGQALVSMPLMAPLSDILGISRQTAVLAFILGDGLSNLIVPTNGVLLAMLGFAKIPFEQWFKFVFRLFLISIVVAFLFVAIAIFIGY